MSWSRRTRRRGGGAAAERRPDHDMGKTMVEGRLSFRVDGEAGAEFGWKFDQLALGACDAVHGKEEVDVEEEELRKRNGSWLGFICRG